jgi:hypothetical protein
MQFNMGVVDRGVRVLLAVVVMVLIASGLLSGAAAVILGIFSAVFLLTSFVGFCPLYLPFRLNTRENKNDA